MAGMTFWKPHALAKPHANQLDLRIGDRVLSTVDLQGVPSGTEGKVILANGFNWQRCSSTAPSSATSISATSSPPGAPPSAWRRPPSAPDPLAHRPRVL
jgi:hypothetical protein